MNSEYFLIRCVPMPFSPDCMIAVIDYGLSLNFLHSRSRKVHASSQTRTPRQQITSDLEQWAVRYHDLGLPKNARTSHTFLCCALSSACLKIKLQNCSRSFSAWRAARDLFADLRPVGILTRTLWARKDKNTHEIVPPKLSLKILLSDLYARGQST